MEYVGLTRFDSISQDVNRLGRTQKPLQSVAHSPPSPSQKFPYLSDDDSRRPPSPITVSPITLYVNRPPGESDADIIGNQSPHSNSYNILRYKRDPPPPSLSSDGSLLMEFSGNGSTSLSSQWLYVLRKGIRGFGVGFCLRLAYATIPLLLKHISSPLKVLSILTRPSFYIKPLRYGTFVSTFVSIFHSCMTLTKKSQDLNRHTRAFFAAFLSGLSLYLVPSEDRQGIAIFTVSRALEVFCKACVAAQILPGWEHADTALFTVSSAYVVWAWLYAPWCMDKGYVKFLNQHTGFRDGMLHALSMQVHGAGVHPPATVEDGISFGYGNIKNRSNGITLEQIVQHAQNNAIQSGIMTSSSSSSSSSSSLPDTTIPTATLVASPLPPLSLSEAPNELISSLTSFNALSDTNMLSSSSVSSSSLPSSSVVTHPCSHHIDLLSRPILLPPDMIQSVNAWFQQRHAVPLNLESLTDPDKLTCHLFHPHCPSSCLIGNTMEYPLMMSQAIKTYLPVYLLPGLLFRWKTLLHDPLNWFKHIATSTGRSALFFTNMSFGGVFGVCLYRLYIGKIFGNTHRRNALILPLSVSFAGCLSILTEQKSKRIELGLFGLSQAIKCWIKLTQSLYPEVFDNIPHIINPVTIFALSAAIMISASMASSGLLRPTYFSLIGWFLGKDTPGLSNHDITTHMDYLTSDDDDNSHNSRNDNDDNDALTIATAENNSNRNNNNTASSLSIVV